MTKNPNIYLSKDDFQVLDFLLRGKKERTATAALLREELARAVVLDQKAVPSDCVGINSVVQLMDLDTQEIETYTPTLPAKANADDKRVSVLAPIGAALLGYREGDRFEWPMPGGVRKLKVLKVEREVPQATMHPPYSLSGAMSR